jgi:hypothetical protein
MTAASPSPSPIRAAISAAIETDAAHGVSSVKTDHHTTQIASTRLPPKRVASQPLATMKSM